MKETNKIIYVYLDQLNKPVLIGRLFVETVRAQEVYSFEYDNDFLSNTNYSFFIDPELPLYPGRIYAYEKNFFGVFSDSCPDRWGRMLMNRREKILADKEDRKPNKLFESDYLIGVYDQSRMGALRFKMSEDGPFLSDDNSMSIPVWTKLRSLEEASRRLEDEDDNDLEKWLMQLIQPGSSLGGARPKASVVDNNGDLWIAKFPSRNDENNVGAWEKIAIDLGKMCGLDVPETKLEDYSELGSTFLTKRFDRDGSNRIHVASAMTLLGKKDGANASDGTSYLDIANFIKAYGVDSKNDLKELWKRIVFNMAISNTDDHLRNHSFIMKDKGWKLSPLYDVNPTTYGNNLALNVDSSDNSIDIQLALDTAIHYGLKLDEAYKEAENIINIVNNNWRLLAQKYKLSNRQINDMEKAFSIKSI